jgi:hypothetical protein
MLVLNANRACTVSTVPRDLLLLILEVCARPFFYKLSLTIV